MRYGIAFVVAGLAAGVSLPADAAMLTQEVCADLARHEAAGSVAYQPGVTVRGGRVVAADLRPAEDATPMPATVDVSVLLKDSVHLPVAGGRLRGEVPVGLFQIRRDGTLLYAGQPLTPLVQQDVSAVCRRAYGLPQ